MSSGKNSRRQNPDVLLPVRSRKVLQWHFRCSLMRRISTAGHKAIPLPQEKIADRRLLGIMHDRARDSLNARRPEWPCSLSPLLTEGWSTGDDKLPERAQTPTHPQRQRSNSRQKCHRLLDSVISVMLALTCLELCLRLVFTGLGDFPKPAAIVLSGGPCAREITVRQYYEGISVAHYCSDGARVTSQRFLKDVPFGVLLGDSCVQS